MAEFFAVAPVLAFAAFALGAVLAIRAMLRDMADTFRQIAEEPALPAMTYPATYEAVTPRETCRKPAGAEIVDLPRRAAGIRPTLRAQLPAAA